MDEVSVGSVGLIFISWGDGERKRDRGRGVGAGMARKRVAKTLFKK